MTTSTVLRRALWAAAAASWAASMIAATVLISTGYRLGAAPILAWLCVVMNLTIGAFLGSLIPDLASVAARAYLAGREDAQTEVPVRRIR